MTTVLCLVSLGRIQTTCPRLAMTTCSCSSHQRLLLFYFLFASCSPTNWSQVGGGEFSPGLGVCLFYFLLFLRKRLLFSRCSFHLTNVKLIYRSHIEAPDHWCRIGIGQMSVNQVSCSAERRSVCINWRKADLFWFKKNLKDRNTHTGITDSS